MKTVKFTREGFEKIKDEYEELKHKRVLAVDDLKKARELGDLSENGYYKAARMKLSSIDARIRSITSLMESGVVVAAGNEETIGIGSKVVLKSTEHKIQYEIVGDLEADPSRGKISLLSPIGKSIAGRKVGDKIEVKIPVGTITYTIVSVSL